MTPHHMPLGVGWIEVIAGCMFSGKTEELIRRIRRAQFAHLPVVVFKPAMDTRYSVDSVDSHGGLRIHSFRIQHSSEITSLVGKAQVVGIDEAQFLDHDLAPICDDLARSGKRVIIAGLDLDFRGEPFGPMPRLMAIAEYVTKTHALCVVCGRPAARSQRTSRATEQVLLGEKEAYEARCRLHWDPDSHEVAQENLPFGVNLAEAHCNK